jgi:tetratricopeptide (TPR) repeat protein
MFDAEYAFRDKKWKEALYGTDKFLGFETLLEKSKSETKTRRLVKIYAGICYLHLEKYDKAIEILKSIDPMEDYIMSGVLPMLIADAYSFKGDTEKALNFYNIAAQLNKSTFFDGIILNKLAILYYTKGEYEKSAETAKELLKRNIEHSNVKVALELINMIETRVNSF